MRLAFVCGIGLATAACAGLLGAEDVGYRTPDASSESGADAGADGEARLDAAAEAADSSGAAPDAAPTFPVCASATCDATSPVCCLFYGCSGTDQSTCVANAGMCTNSCTFVVTCSRTSDCSAGGPDSICCAQYDSLDKTFLSASCERIGPCQGGNHRVLCDPSAPIPCPLGEPCIPDARDPSDPYHVCQGL